MKIPAAKVPQLALALLCLILPSPAADEPKPAPVPAFSPAQQPVVTGEFAVGFITITFKETEIPGGLATATGKVDQVVGTHNEAGHGAAAQSSGSSSGGSLGEYFKTYSNGIAWPKIVTMPDDNSVFADPHLYGYFCEYDYWENPIGWKERKEGDERVGKMNQEALRFANKSYRGTKPVFICYNYVTTRPATPAPEANQALLHFYDDRGADPGRTRLSKARKKRKQKGETRDYNPWDYYSPVCKWGEPMWPNSKIQITDFSGGTLAHELGHCLGAPDLYRIGRFNDGIGGAASLMAYGPTANAFSRFYHHAYIKEKNYPTLKTSGTYTLHPRDIDPKGDEAVGYLIPSNHPHYVYQVEYIHNENNTVGVGPGKEGMLISAVNLGLTSYLGSPDFFYVYRPNDPFFRGEGNAGDCLFGKSHNRPEFNMTTEPSSRLPNLMDGGVSFNNIEEHDGTLTFDFAIDRHPVSGGTYTKSMLPLMRLDEISDVQPTSFTMDSTVEFRGEPLIVNYGFCWSTSAKPTVRDSTYTLTHRDSFRGHAIDLNPNTTYYVRAFASNGVGVRYSDEEKTVKTPDSRTESATVGPLLTDSFSHDGYLYDEFSDETTETGESFVGYSPTCVLAKLIAYYRPGRFESAGKNGGRRTSYVNFNQLNWHPGTDDPLERLEEIDGFFRKVEDQSRALGFHAPEPDKDFVRNLVKLTGVRSKPVLSLLGPENISEVSDLIRMDLRQSRPAMIVFSYDSESVTDPVRWAIIDGIDASGRFHVDFPRGSKFLIDGEWIDAKSGFSTPDEFLLPLYKAYVVTSCYYPK